MHGHPGRDLALTGMKCDTFAVDMAHHQCDVLHRKWMSQQAVAHASPGRIGDLAFLKVEARVRKAFEIAGYTKEEVDTNFSGMINAFKFGAPPHGGSAPGIDRIVMLLADEPNIREVILFPMNQKAEDLMMNAPATVLPKQLKELHIKVVADS